MNMAEMVKWQDDVERRWPSAARWFRENPETVRIWHEEKLSDVSLSDCLTANRKLDDDTTTEMAPWHLERLAVRVRSIAKQLESDRVERDRGRQRKPSSVDRRGSMAAALGGLLKPGLTPDERMDILRKEFPRDDDGPRHRCPVCRDTGCVTIYHPETVVAMYRHVKHDGPEPKIYTAVAACNCVAGNKFDHDGLGKDKRTVRLKRLSDRNCVCEAVTKAEQLQELLPFASEYRPANYVSEFDNF